MNWQSVSGQQGRRYEDTCAKALQDAGFVIDRLYQEIYDAGVEVAIIATNRHDISFYVLCTGTRPGARRTAAIKQAVAAAYALQRQGWGPVLLLTAQLSQPPRAQTLLGLGLALVLFDAVPVALAPLPQLRATAGYARLAWLADAPEADLRRDLAARRLTLRRAAPDARGAARAGAGQQLSWWQQLSALLGQEGQA